MNNMERIKNSVIMNMLAHECYTETETFSGGVFDLCEKWQLLKERERWNFSIFSCF